MSNQTDDNLVGQIFGDDQAVTETTGEPEQGLDAVIPEPEKLLVGKFKNVEELERAYQESERWGTKNAQEVNQLRKEMEQLRQSVAPDMTQKQQQQWREYVQQAINTAVVDENPDELVRFINWIVDQKTEAKFNERYQDVAPAVEQYRFQSEVNAFLAENPEAASHIDDMVRLIQEQPELVAKPNWLDKTYTKVLAKKINGTSQANADNAAKTKSAKQAAAMSGSGQRATQNTESEEDKIKKALFGDTGKRKMFDY